MLVDNGLQNYTSARDCALLLGMIYRGECVTAAYSEKMLELLKAQQRISKIPAGVPKGVVTANKTGELTGLSECDAAIVFAEESPYILCILSQPQDNSAAVRRIVEISRTVYDAIAGGG
jgi:beta-lactamase class A